MTRKYCCSNNFTVKVWRNWKYPQFFYKPICILFANWHWILGIRDALRRTFQGNYYICVPQEAAAVSCEMSLAAQGTWAPAVKAECVLPWSRGRLRLPTRGSISPVARSSSHSSGLFHLPRKETFYLNPQLVFKGKYWKGTYKSSESFSSVRVII